LEDLTGINRTLLGTHTRRITEISQRSWGWDLQAALGCWRSRDHTLWTGMNRSFWGSLQGFSSHGDWSLPQTGPLGASPGCGRSPGSSAGLLPALSCSVPLVSDDLETPLKGRMSSESLLPSQPFYFFLHTVSLAACKHLNPPRQLSSSFKPEMLHW